MPLLQQYKKVVILGSGPIVIGQACEFDYSGTQACKALVAENLEVVLINSNPATIMTDPDIASRTYIEPLKRPFVEKILDRERPQALMATLGGQTALNLGLELSQSGVLDKLGIDLLGVTAEVIRRAEDREVFNQLLRSVGAKHTKSFMVRTFKQGLEVVKELGFPVILRPNFTLGGGGGGVAYSQEEYEISLVKALGESPTSEVLVEESILGWKEYELEVMRDHKGIFVVICAVENLDPCGVHTGDSITVAPQQTLSERAYQDMRDEARRILDAVGLECGGANIQFAVNPVSGDRIVIEMNPRVSRSSALASKATGFPIAKIAALLAVGYSLDEIQNDITQTTPACYEPALDYVVTKIPRFAFEKFLGSKDQLSTQMKSVGEVMAIGRTFKESLQKALCAQENSCGFQEVSYDKKKLAYPNSRRLYQVAQAFRQGESLEEVWNLTQIAPWFLKQIKDLMDAEEWIRQQGLEGERWLWAKRQGFSDLRLSQLLGQSLDEVREQRLQLGIRPSYLPVDTCAGEFASMTPYFYSTYWFSGPKLGEVQLPTVQIQGGQDQEGQSQVEKTRDQKGLWKKPSVVVIGSGPNRIGQGIEFDYCCVRGVQKLRQMGFDVTMVNSNPETVSTDYDTANQLYFEPLDMEHVLGVIDRVSPMGVVLQLGGQTPLSLIHGLEKLGVPILGSSLSTIDGAEDRNRFKDVCQGVGFEVPVSGLAHCGEEALEQAQKIGYPLICRPSYVLGGQRMEIIESQEELEKYFQKYESYMGPDSPCFMDQFLEEGIEVDVDLVRGSDWCVLGGVVEHIEAAGVHSGDSMGVLPPQRLKKEIVEKIQSFCIQLAHKMKVIGHLNVQLAVREDRIFIIEANPRCSRTLPFLAKATGIPLVDLGIQAMMGIKRSELELSSLDWRKMKEVCVKGVVFPFKKFPDSDSILGPEMKSTGESMGRGMEYSEALMKAFVSSQMEIPLKGEVFLSLREQDKPVLLPVARRLIEMGFSLSATRGTASFLYENGLDCIPVKKVHEGRPHCVDRIRSHKVVLVINTTSGRRAIEDSFSIRRSCIDFAVPCVTEDHAAEALVLAMTKKLSGQFDVYPL